MNNEEISKIPHSFETYYHGEGFEQGDVIAFHLEFQKKYQSFVTDTLSRSLHRTIGTDAAPEVLRLLHELTGLTLEELFREHAQLLPERR